MNLEEEVTKHSELTNSEEHMAQLGLKENPLQVLVLVEHLVNHHLNNQHLMIFFLVKMEINL